MGKVPLKTVLRNFLDHYNNLENSYREKAAVIEEIKNSGRETPPPLSLYEQEYIKLKELTESLKSDSNYPMNEGQSDVNRKKNRYKDILPYDKSRVILSEYPGVPGSDYINANYVRGSSGNQRAYIASQGPLPNTLVDYWRMIWETEVLVIIMACNEREAGKYKCEPYWPLNPDEQQQYGNITVKHVKWRQVCPDFLVRTFQVFADNEERTICQFHYTTWPDHGVPVSVHPILELVRLMRDVQSTESRPILVHCSAGCGRTGTICSIDYVWALLRTGKLRENFSLYEIISDMRKQRTSMVQTVEQYILCYKAVATLFEQHLKLIDTHTYQNIDGDGEPLGIKSHIKEGEESSLSEQSLTLSSEQNSNEDVAAAPELPIKPNKRIEPKAETYEPKQSLLNAESSHLNRSQSFVEACDEGKHQERIVGKATVIRRPSIAKLKAIFDNPANSIHASSYDVTEPLSSHNIRSARLQRSQSIKENIRNLNFNIQLEINQSKTQDKRSKSYTLSAAKLSVYKKHFSIGNLDFQNERLLNELQDERADFSNSRDEATIKLESSNTLSQNLSDVTRNMFQERENSASINGYTQSESQVDTKKCSTSQTSKQHESSFSAGASLPSGSFGGKPTHIPQGPRGQSRPPSLDESHPGAPPKPPRTYQHIVDDSCIVRTAEGRLIVTVAQPRQPNTTESSFIPIHVKNAQPNYSGNSIYERLGPRKFHLSSPNLVLSDQVNFISPSDSSQLKVQPQIKTSFVAENSNENPIYGNSLASKSYPRSLITVNSNPNSQTPMPESYAFFNGASQYPLDVFGNQHFQYHQAKPIILQQNFFEPIYGATTRAPFLPPRSSNLMPPSQTPSNCLGLPSRPISLSQGNFKAPNQNYLSENIYSNREICFKVANSSKSFDHLATNSNNPNFVPIRVQPKENVYAEIGSLVPSKNGTDSNKKSSETKSKTGTDLPSKPSPLSKIRSVLKVFRMKSSFGSKQTAPLGNNTATKSSENGSSNNFSASANSKVPNGASINPLNGQPLSRPPHSHRFQPTTQWTQV